MLSGNRLLKVRAYLQPFSLIRLILDFQLNIANYSASRNSGLLVSAGSKARTVGRIAYPLLLRINHDFNRAYIFLIRRSNRHFNNGIESGCSRTFLAKINAV